MRVRELLPHWPPGVWVGSYPGAGLTAPDLTKAILEGAVAKGYHVQLTISDGGRTYSTAIQVPTGQDPKRMAKVISAATGKAFDEAGDLEIEQV